MEVEEQLYQHLEGEDRRPIFLNYYVPGGHHWIQYMKECQKVAKKHQDAVVFMHVNCKKNVQFWSTKEMGVPNSELIFPYEESENDEDQLGKTFNYFLVPAFEEVGLWF